MVVVVHEIFGLSTWVRGVADQVAADGFIAIAPDFLSRLRGGPTSVELPGDSARKLIATLNAALRQVLEMPELKKRALDLGIEAKASSPVEILDRLKADIDKWAEVIERAAIAKQ